MAEFNRALFAPAVLTEAELEGFKLEWDALPRGVRDMLDARLEWGGYVDAEDYRRQELWSADAQRVAAAYSVRMDFRDYTEELLATYWRGREIIAAGDYSIWPSAAERQIKWLLSSLKRALLAEVGIPSNKRKVLTREEQHREWSGLMYAGRKPMDLTTRIFSEWHIRDAVADYRGRRLSMQWALRYLLWREVGDLVEVWLQSQRDDPDD